MLEKGPKLRKVIAETLGICSKIVGSTLGPGGMGVIIEQQEIGRPPVVTKDGVSVFKAMAFYDAERQVLLESIREAATRTASEAGDGTTTATILADALVNNTMKFCENNPNISPQLVSRILQQVYRDRIVQLFSTVARRASLDGAEKELLESVARISANGDVELAKAVIKCFEAIGDEGNVTITEATGVTEYVVEKIEGYPLPFGFEDCCGPFYAKFINDKGAQACVLESPTFILNNGKLVDFNQLYPILNKIAEAINAEVRIEGQRINHNIVLMATGFSESVLANLAAGFPMAGTLNVFPFLVPPSPINTGQLEFLNDIQALTGARIFSLMDKPLQDLELEDLGFGPTLFESTRFRSNIVGRRSPELVIARTEILEQQLGAVATSDLERTFLRERKAKLTSGIAKLIVRGNSYGDTKERKDRAEDAICAVRGAIAHGILPGGGATLMHLCKSLMYVPDPLYRPTIEQRVIEEVLIPSLKAPVSRLYENANVPSETMHALDAPSGKTFDVLGRKMVNAWKAGILDSLPAVREAVKNSISIAAQMGTCGAVISFMRDDEADRDEARDTRDFERNSNVNEANERG